MQMIIYIPINTKDLHIPYAIAFHVQLYRMNVAIEVMVGPIISELRATYPFLL